MKNLNTVTAYLARVSKCIDEHGWVSRGAAYKSDDKTATADCALEADLGDLSADNLNDAEDAILWASLKAADFDNLNDYEAKAVASVLTVNPRSRTWELRDSINPRSIGYAASIVTVARREKARAASAAKFASLKGGYLGNVGEKFATTNATLIEVKHMARWDCHLHKFATDTGNILTWMTKRRVGDVNDRLLRLSGTVKGHRVWDGNEETQITRCKYITG